MNQLANDLSESGLIPDRIIRHGIHQLLKARLETINAADLEMASVEQTQLISDMQDAAIAVLTDKANEQHYEVPAAFFDTVLGKQHKYSCAYWPEGVNSLNDAETAGLELTCERVGIEDGMKILELGCGWGSLTHWMASHYPNSQITAVSNSHSQGEFVRQKASDSGLSNINVITADMNDFQTDQKFDRVISVEMFEHMRNWPALFQRISQWMHPDGEFFMHIFVHRTTAYLFEDKDDSDWMSRHFFSGGMMPSADLAMNFQDDLKLSDRWFWDGRHYERTSNAWLENMDRNKEVLWPLFEQTYGKDFAKTWWMRWRMFFMACAELFGYNDGQEWFVSHYKFRQNRV